MQNVSMVEKEPSFEKFIPILLLVVVILSFVVGILWQKVRNIEGSDSSDKVAGTSVGVRGEENSTLSIDSIKIYAKELGLNEKEFNSCLDDGKMEEKIFAEIEEGSLIGATGTPAFFVNGIKISGAQPYSVFRDTFEYELAGGDWDNPSEKVAYLIDGNAGNGEIVIPRVDVEIGDAPVKGNGDALITFIEWSDFECSYCTKFFNDTYSKIQEDYIDTGKVKMVYKQLPLSFHKYSQKAAEATLCAQEQDKFWEMHDKLFSSQQI